MMTPRHFAGLGALLAGFSVLLGAFGAHGLAAHLTPKMMEVYEVAVRYQMYHALALFVVASGMAVFPSRYLPWSGLCFLLGTLLFSGSLYLLILTQVKMWGAITPLGGLLFLAGWGFLAWGIFNYKKEGV